MNTKMDFLSTDRIAKDEQIQNLISANRQLSDEIVAVNIFGSRTVMLLLFKYSFSKVVGKSVTNSGPLMFLLAQKSSRSSVVREQPSEEYVHPRFGHNTKPPIPFLMRSEKRQASN